jgi:selenoprotein W-related protein
MADLPHIEIEYCRQCRWLLRAAWMAQELLVTFEDELGGVTLVPGMGGIFEVRPRGGEVLWSRKTEGRFPEMKGIEAAASRPYRPGSRPRPFRPQTVVRRLARARFPFIQSPL